MTKDKRSKESEGDMVDFGMYENIDTNKTSIEKFKKLILDMHKGVPHWLTYGAVENLIKEKEIRDYFFENDIFVDAGKRDSGGKLYFLGVNGINLANSFLMEESAKKTKELTAEIKGLTWALIIMAFVTTLSTIANVFIQLF